MAEPKYQFQEINDEDNPQLTQKAKVIAFKPEKQEREYYADWMRATSIHLVIMVHSVWIARASTALYDQNNLPDKEELEQQTIGFVKILVQCGIPIFFYISGQMTNYFNTLRPGNNFYKFAIDKFKRLMVPFLVAIPIILIPRLYLAQEYQLQSCVKYTYASDNAEVITGCDIESNIVKYAWGILPQIYQKLSWLWFLPALFINSCINYPLLAWTQRRASNIPIDWNIDCIYPAGQILAIAVWCLPNLAVKEMTGNSTMPLVMTNVIFYFAWFSLQLMLKGENCHRYSLLLKLVGPLSAIVMNYFKDGGNTETVYGFMCMINYDLMFMCQGLIDQTYMKMQLKSRGEWAETMIAPACLIIYSLAMSITSPSVTKGADYLFFYPLYEPKWLMNTYTMGSYFNLFMLTWWCQDHSNKVFSKYWYDVVVGTSTWAYLSHYLWLVVTVYFITRPFKFGYVTSILTIWVCTLLQIFWSNRLLEYLFKKNKKPKKKETKENDDRRVKANHEELQNEDDEISAKPSEKSDYEKNYRIN